MSSGRSWAGAPARRVACCFIFRCSFFSWASSRLLKTSKAISTKADVSIPSTPSTLFLIFIYLSIYLSIYLFIWLCWILVAARGLFIAARGLFVAARGRFVAARGLFVAARGLLSSCGAWAPERVGSIVAACGILIPQPGIEPTSPALEGGFLTPGSPGKSHAIHFLQFFLDVWSTLANKSHILLPLLGSSGSVSVNCLYVSKILPRNSEGFLSGLCLSS